MLCIHLGTPPTRFTWQWTDRNGQFHRDEETTPQAFAAKYVTLPVEDYVCLVHDPRPTSPVGRTFTVEYLGNVVGGTRVKYLNVPVETMKAITQRTIESGEPVWFGCDVGKQMRRDLGLWDARLFDYNGVYGTRVRAEQGAASRLWRHANDARDALYGRRQRGRARPPLARRELVGRGKRRQRASSR